MPEGGSGLRWPQVDELSRDTSYTLPRSLTSALALTLEGIALSITTGSGSKSSLVAAIAAIYLDFLAGFCLLGFRGTTARATMTRLLGFLTRRFCFRFAFGFAMPISCQSRMAFR
jgi:hypothetical protein